MSKRTETAAEQRLRREIRDLDQRVRGVEGVTKLTVAVQRESLAAAEKLRRPPATPTSSPRGS